MMHAAPIPSSEAVSVPVRCSRTEHRSKAVHDLANSASLQNFAGPKKSDQSFRDQSRAEDAALIALAFPGPSQAAIARKGHKLTGVSARQITYYLNQESDAPGWFLKMCLHHVRIQQDEQLPGWLKRCLLKVMKSTNEAAQRIEAHR